MTATHLAKMVDKVALSLMNTFVVLGLPLVAVGLLTQAI